MQWILDWFSSIWNQVVSLRNAISGWFGQTWERILGVATAIAVLRAEMDARFTRVDAAIADIRDLLVTPPVPPPSLVFSIHIEGHTLRGVTQMTLKPGKRYRASVTTQPEGSRVDGALTWESSDETVLTAAPEGDGKTAIVNALADGVATLRVSGDADLSGEVRPIEVTVGVIVGLEAENLTVDFVELPDEPPVEG